MPSLPKVDSPRNEYLHPHSRMLTTKSAMSTIRGSSEYFNIVHDKLTNKELRSLLKSYSLPVDGNQVDLRGRLQQRYLNWGNASPEDIRIVRSFFTKEMTKKKLLKELIKRGLNGRPDHKVEDLRRILTIYEMERGMLEARRVYLEFWEGFSLINSR